MTEKIPIIPTVILTFCQFYLPICHVRLTFWQVCFTLEPRYDVGA